MNWYWKSKYYGGKWWTFHWHAKWFSPTVGVTLGTGMWYVLFTYNLLFVGGFIRLGPKRPDYPGMVDVSE